MPKISLFKSVLDTKNYTEYDLEDYLEKTKIGEWEDIVNKCRTIQDKKERDEFKRTMPTATLSGLFSKRRDDSLIIHSEYIAMDIDELDDINASKRHLENDKYCYSVFMSTSGRGLRALFKIDPDKHRESFESICKYLFDNYSIVCDQNGSNASKPYVVSFDPYLYIAKNGVPVFNKLIKKKKSDEHDVEYVYNKTDFDKIYEKIITGGINICESYQDWLKLGFAISSQFGEDGRSKFHRISSISNKYSVSLTDKQYNSCLRARGSSKINISTFYFLAKQNGIDVYTEQTKEIIKTVRSGKKAGLSKEKIIENLSKFSDINNADDLVEKVYENSRIKASDDDGSIIDQLEMFIDANYNIRMNEVNGYLENDGIRLEQSDLNSIFISAKKLMPKLDYQLMMRLLKSNFIRSYNPFFEFWGSDGIPADLPPMQINEQPEIESPLIDKLALTIKNENPEFTRYFLKKWIVGIVSAAHKVHSPLLLCLLGKQHTGKTEFFRRLLPKELQEYYAESKLDREKDDELLMTENLIIMDDELGGKSKQDALKLKNLTSKQYFSLRRPYADHNEKIIRLAVLCGTSNYNEVLVDNTGNRRIIPIEVNDIDKSLYNSINKKDLFDEAFNVYKAGFDWRVGHLDIPYLNGNKDRYETVNKEREIISKYFAEGNETLTSTDIMIELENITRQRLSALLISREMESLGFSQSSSQVSRHGKMWKVSRINRGGLYGDRDEKPF